MTFATVVSVDCLRDHLDDPHWVVMDCRFRLAEPDAGRHSYAGGHIPDARYADLDRDLAAAKTATSGRHPLPDPNVFAARASAWGIDERTQVVVYDDANGAIAARLWWLLRWLGHDAVAVLDGGIAAWQASGGELETAAPSVAPSCFVPRYDRMPHVDAQFILSRLRQPGWHLFDARTAERYRGEREPIDPVKGHIPGAINRPFEQNLDPHGRFLSPESIKASLRAQLGDVSPQDVVHMCGSGVTACHNLLAMEIAGLIGSRLYPGSWSEWICDPKRPIARD